jgi:hypothetical protein
VHLLDVLRPEHLPRLPHLRCVVQRHVRRQLQRHLLRQLQLPDERHLRLCVRLHQRGLPRRASRPTADANSAAASDGPGAKAPRRHPSPVDLHPHSNIGRRQ